MFKGFINKALGWSFVLVILGTISTAAQGKVDGSFNPPSGESFVKGGKMVVTVEVTPNPLESVTIKSMDVYVFFDGRAFSTVEVGNRLAGGDWGWTTEKVYHDPDGLSWIQYSRGTYPSNAGITLSAKTPLYHLSGMIKNTYSESSLTLYLGRNPQEQRSGYFKISTTTTSDAAGDHPDATYLLRTNQPPTVPILRLPTDESTDIPRNPTFVWDPSTDSDGGIISYTLMADNYSSFNSPEINLSTNETTVISPNTLDPGTYYHWKVIASDGQGGYATSEVWEFTTIAGPNITSVTWDTSTPTNEANKYYVYGVLSIEGSGFSNDPGLGLASSEAFNVKLNNKKLSDLRLLSEGVGIYYWSTNKITVGVPLSAEGTYLVAGDLTVEVTANNLSDTERNLYLKPRIYSITPTSGVIGAVVTLEGTAFGADISQVEWVEFGYTSSPNIGQADNTKLTVTVPSRNPGEVSVQARVNGRSSNDDVKFTILAEMYLDLTVLLQGYYNDNGASPDTQRVATVEVEFRKGTGPDNATYVLTSDPITLGTSGSEMGRGRTKLTGLTSGDDYYLVVRQVNVTSTKGVNHLAIMTNNDVDFTNNITTEVDLSDTLDSGKYKEAYNLYEGTNSESILAPMVTYTNYGNVKTYKLLRGGDADGDGMVMVTNDFQLWAEAADLKIYNPAADFNGNGSIGEIDPEDLSIWSVNEGQTSHVPYIGR